VCNVGSVLFCFRSLSPEIVRGKRVLEVGSADVNGGVREVLERWGPAEYLGIDIAPGKNVDLVCPIEDLPRHFDPGSFDVVVSTEVLEHVRDWKTAVRNLKYALKPGGHLLLTTRSYGMPYHGYPHDFWRFEDEDCRAIFADMNVLSLEKDRSAPGIMLLATKVPGAAETVLDDIQAYSIVTGRRCSSISDADLSGKYFAKVLRRERLCARVDYWCYRINLAMRLC
jgi:SAM-dependent methyltransferase